MGKHEDGADSFVSDTFYQELHTTVPDLFTSSLSSIEDFGSIARANHQSTVPEELTGYWGDAMPISIAGPTISLSPQKCQENYTVIEPHGFGGALEPTSSRSMTALEPRSSGVGSNGDHVGGGAASGITVLQNRTSYEEVVHKDYLPHTFNGSWSLTRLVTTLAEWLVVLRGIAEERQADTPPVRCRCGKANKIAEELDSLRKKLSEAEQLSERVGMVPADKIEAITNLVLHIAALLRSDVSILIPTSIGGADPMVAEQASTILQELQSRNSMSETIDGVSSLVLKLLGVGDCFCCNPKTDEIRPGLVSPPNGYQDPPAAYGGTHQLHGNEHQPGPHEIDEDIMKLVAGMVHHSPSGLDSRMDCGGGGSPGSSSAPGEDDPESHSSPAYPQNLREIGRAVVERSRKRKQVLPTSNFALPPSPASPSAATPPTFSILKSARLTNLTSTTSASSETPNGQQLLTGGPPQRKFRRTAYSPFGRPPAPKGFLSGPGLARKWTHSSNQGQGSSLRIEDDDERMSSSSDTDDEDDLLQGGEGQPQGTSSIVATPMHPAVLTLLEKKKKQPKKDGLYKFVLWKEALKDEKAKSSTSPSTDDLNPSN